MADVREERIYCAEQIVVPPELPIILKHYSKEIIRMNPENIYEASREFLFFNNNNKCFILINLF